MLVRFESAPCQGEGSQKIPHAPDCGSKCLPRTHVHQKTPCLQMRSSNLMDSPRFTTSSLTGRPGRATSMVAAGRFFFRGIVCCTTRHGTQPSPRPLVGFQGALQFCQVHGGGPPWVVHARRATETRQKHCAAKPSSECQRRQKHVAAVRLVRTAQQLRPGFIIISYSVAP